MSEKAVQLTVHLDPVTLEKMKVIAEEEMRSVSQVMGLAVREFLRRREASHVEGTNNGWMGGSLETASNKSPVIDLRRGRQVDLEEAIASSKRSPKKAVKRK
jgi:hypothetical protein